MIRKQQKDAGFSLLEAVIALFILTVSLLSVAQLMILSLDKSEFAKSDTKAIQLAQAKAEELRQLYGRSVATSQSVADLSAGSHGPVTVILDSPEDRIQGQKNFQVSWTIQNLTAGQKAVSVTVAPAIINPRQSETITLTTRFSP